jgi:hypothetical protein
MPSTVAGAIVFAAGLALALLTLLVAAPGGEVAAEHDKVEVVQERVGHETLARRASRGEERGSGPDSVRHAGKAEEAAEASNE